MSITLSHRGICVSDLEASTRFYREALGFEPYADHGVVEGPAMEQTMEMPGVRLHAVMLRHPDGPVIELLHFLAPPAFGPRERRSTIQYGLVHLSFRVDDMDAAAARLKAAGGHVFEETRARFDAGGTTMLYCTDPDGVRIELMQMDGQPAGFSHSGICVENVDKAMPYYEAMGFAPAENYVLDGGFDWLATVNEIPGIKLRAQMMRDAAGNTIELLETIEPQSFGPRERRPLNQYGLTHIAFWVDDVDAEAARLEAAGGSWVAAARIVTPGIELHHGADRDGVRIELMRAITA
ncbi:Catechol 2,3-dioxygenase [Sphingomonas laterariae]|uniref:Catechol 2,3-dioxygenase n=1 Tax=Edaphosphingomonas laterariae TaxID=861865 RepID=A0A239JMH1_9SPHN|nr:VOC family protein [Sphingomonas laterariae]SNT07025.1 Catechol 2,3-dioxygenase [Sphingomonas laterariae]